MNLRQIIATFCLFPILLILTAGCAVDSKQDWFAKADGQVLKGDYRGAVDSLNRYLDKNPDGALRDKALFRSGEILYFSLGDRATGVRNFSRLVQQFPSSIYAYRAHEILAEVFRDETKEYLSAVLEYKWLIKQRPDHEKAPWYQFQAAKCYLLSGAYEQAVLEFGRLLQDYPESDLTDQAYDELGGAYLILGRPEQALFIYRKLLEQFPEGPLAMNAEFRTGNALEDMHQYSDALAVYQGLLDRHPNRPAVETRIAGVKTRLEVQGSDVKRVDYNYRPDETNETLKNFDEEKKK